METTIVCNKCFNEYPETTEYYHINKQSGNGLHTTCKACRSIARKKRYKFEKKTGAIDLYYNENRLKFILRNLNKRGGKKIKESQLLSILSNFKIENGNNVCPYCNREIFDITMIHFDHYLPLAQGGDNTVTNLIPVCKYCNRSKLNEIFITWYRQQLFYSPKTENRIIKYTEGNRTKKFFLKGHIGITVEQDLKNFIEGKTDNSN